MEDDAATRELLSRALKADGWKIREAVNGRIGLDQVKRSIPSLVLLDLMMPELDGFDFMDGLRKLPGGHDVPVIVITAKDLTPEDRDRLNGQVRRVLHKSAYAPEELLDEVRTLAQVHQVQPVGPAG